MARNSSVDSSLSAAALRPLVGPESSPKRPQKMSWCLQVRGSHSEAVLEPVHFVAVASAGADLWRILVVLFTKPETGQALAESGLERGWGGWFRRRNRGRGPLVVFVQQYLRARPGVARRWSSSTLFRKWMEFCPCCDWEQEILHQGMRV